MQPSCTYTICVLGLYKGELIPQGVLRGIYETHEDAADFAPYHMSQGLLSV